MRDPQSLLDAAANVVMFYKFYRLTLVTLFFYLLALSDFDIIALFIALHIHCF